MLNLISILIGLIALPLALIAFLPLLGWFYWFVVPIAIVGLVCGVLSRGKTGRNLNLIVIVVGVLRPIRAVQPFPKTLPARLPSIPSIPVSAVPGAAP